MRAVRAALAARVDRVLPFLPDFDDFELFLWLVAGERLVCVGELPVCLGPLAVVWPATGDAAISAASRPESQRAQWQRLGHGVELG